MTKSRRKKNKDRKQHRLNNVVDSLYEGHVLAYKEANELRRQGIDSCGYLRSPHYDGQSFYGHCALNSNKCSYKHKTNDYTCPVYQKRYGK